MQMYAYAGFPRSLNGIHTFMAVMDERQAKGIKDAMGKEASPVPADMPWSRALSPLAEGLGGKPASAATSLRLWN